MHRPVSIYGHAPNCEILPLISRQQPRRYGRSQLANEENLSLTVLIRLESFHSTLPLLLRTASPFKLTLQHSSRTLLTIKRCPQTNAALSRAAFNRVNTVQRLSLHIIFRVIYNLIQGLIVTQSALQLLKLSNGIRISSFHMTCICQNLLRRETKMLQSLRCAE